MHPKSIEKVSESYLCCNCGACKVVCPKDAIEIRKTTIGRLFAYVNDECVDCGLCSKVCPTLRQAYGNTEVNRLEGSIRSVYVGKSTDRNIFRNSQSGGICTALLSYLFDYNMIDAALVCRMDYGEPVPMVRPVIVTSKEELFVTQKSCYSPVVLLDNLKGEIKKHSSIAVVGIGCQLEGLVNIESLSEEFRNRIFCKIGLICDRTLCDTIQNVYSEYAPNIRPVKIIWRCKNLQNTGLKFRYEDAPLIVSGRDGQYKQFPNLYRFVLKDMFTSPRCRVCPNKLNVMSDITLGDPWRMFDIDLENGESVIALRTSKGESVFSAVLAAGYITASERPVEQLVKGQLTEERKQQTSAYSIAFNVLSPKVYSKLLTPCLQVSKKEVDKAKIELKDFVERESMSTEEIVKEAKDQISRALHRKTIGYRIIRKILKIFEK